MYICLCCAYSTALLECMDTVVYAEIIQTLVAVSSAVRSLSLFSSTDVPLPSTVVSLDFSDDGARRRPLLSVHPQAPPARACSPPLTIASNHATISSSSEGGLGSISGRRATVGGLNRGDKRWQETAGSSNSNKVPPPPRRTTSKRSSLQHTNKGERRH
jgi:hypothetical protein